MLDNSLKEFVEPLREAVNSKWFLRSGGLDHIFIYTSDDTFSCEARIPPDLRSKLTRVLALSYSARLDCWGKCFRDDQGFCCKNCYRQQEDIAVPSLVPSPRRDWRADNKSSTAGQDNIYRDHAIVFQAPRTIVQDLWTTLRDGSLLIIFTMWFLIAAHWAQAASSDCTPRVWACGLLAFTIIYALVRFQSLPVTVLFYLSNAS